MSPLEYANICMGCMGDKGQSEICPHCGYVEGTPSPNAQYLPPRTMVAGKYLLGRGLGHGGFGITYLAYDTVLKRRLAIKEYLPQDCATRAAGQKPVTPFSAEEKTEQFHYGVDKFLEEARTLAQFDAHPNIVGVRDFFKENNTAYLVMNYLSGETLKEYLRRHDRALTFQQAIKIILPVIDALRNVHAAGVLHRDVSPDNIFLTSNGQVKLIDFGAARQSLGNQRSISVILKPGYAPEEQYRSRGKQGPWTDVYAVGATFYRAITGKVPPESLDRMERETLVPPSRLGVQIPADAENALLRAMAVKAQDRFQTMQEFKDALLQSERPTLTRARSGVVPDQPARSQVEFPDYIQQNRPRLPQQPPQAQPPVPSAQRRAPSHRGEPHRGDPLRGDPLRGEPYRNDSREPSRGTRRAEKRKHTGFQVGLLVATLIILVVVGGVLFGLYLIGNKLDNAGASGTATVPASFTPSMSASVSPTATQSDNVIVVETPEISPTPSPTPIPDNMLPGAASTRKIVDYAPESGFIYETETNGKRSRLLAGKLNFGLVGSASLNDSNQIDTESLNNYYENAEGGLNLAPVKDQDDADTVLPPTLTVGTTWTSKGTSREIVAVNYTATLGGQEVSGCLVIKAGNNYMFYAPGIGLHTIRTSLEEDAGESYRVLSKTATSLNLLELTKSTQ